MSCSLLTVVVDLDERAWAEQGLGVHAVAESVLLFINVFLAQDQDNHVALVASHPDQGVAELVYPLERENDLLASGANARVRLCLLMRRLFGSSTLEESGDEATTTASTPTTTTTTLTTTASSRPTLASALSLAVLYANHVALRTSMGEAGLPMRVLVVTASRDNPAEYVPFMNAAYAAHKVKAAAGMPVDVCDASPAPHSTMLLQVASLTNGLVVRPDPSVVDRQGVLAQVLVQNFLCDHIQRSKLRTPVQPLADMRATCTCHRERLLDVGFTCSVCMSVYCNETALEKGLSKCLRCGSRLKIPQRR